jgi:hypothetical protein
MELHELWNTELRDWRKDVLLLYTVYTNSMKQAPSWYVELQFLLLREDCPFAIKGRPDK